MITLCAGPNKTILHLAVISAIASMTILPSPALAELRGDLDGSGENVEVNDSGNTSNSPDQPDTRVIFRSSHRAKTEPPVSGSDSGPDHARVLSHFYGGRSQISRTGINRFLADGPRPRPDGSIPFRCPPVMGSEPYAVQIVDETGASRGAKVVLASQLGARAKCMYKVVAGANPDKNIFATETDFDNITEDTGLQGVGLQCYVGAQGYFSCVGTSAPPAQYHVHPEQRGEPIPDGFPPKPPAQKQSNNNSTTSSQVNPPNPSMAPEAPIPNMSSHASNAPLAAVQGMPSQKGVKPIATQSASRSMLDSFPHNPDGSLNGNAMTDSQLHDFLSQYKVEKISHGQ